MSLVIDSSILLVWSFENERMTTADASVANMAGAAPRLPAP